MFYSQNIPFGNDSSRCYYYWNRYCGVIIYCLFSNDFNLRVLWVWAIGFKHGNSEQTTQPLK